MKKLNGHCVPPHDRDTRVTVILDGKEPITTSDRAALLLVSEEGEGSIEVMTKEEVRAILNEVLSVRAYYAEDAAHCEWAVEEVAAKHGITL